MKAVPSQGCKWMLMIFFFLQYLYGSVSNLFYLLFQARSKYPIAKKILFLVLIGSGDPEVRLLTCSASLRILQFCEQNIIFSVTRCLKPSDWFKRRGTAFLSEVIRSNSPLCHPTLCSILMPPMLLVRKHQLALSVRKRKGRRKGLNISSSDLTTTSVSSNLYIDGKRLWALAKQRRGARRPDQSNHKARLKMHIYMARLFSPCLWVE